MSCTEDIVQDKTILEIKATNEGEEHCTEENIELKNLAKYTNFNYMGLRANFKNELLE